MNTLFWFYDTQLKTALKLRLEAFPFDYERCESLLFTRSFEITKQNHINNLPKRNLEYQGKLKKKPPLAPESTNYNL